MAKFESGKSGNPEGRPAGSRNRTTEQIREAVREFIDGNMDNLQKDFDRLKSRDRLRFMLGLLKFVLPVAREIDLTVGLKQLSDEQIDELVKKILQNGD